MQANLILDCQNHHGEGIQWNADDHRIWWTDTEADEPEAGGLFAVKPGVRGVIDTPFRG